jgi:outer membrane immunogenic protein
MIMRRVMRLASVAAPLMLLASSQAYAQQNDNGYASGTGYNWSGLYGGGNLGGAFGGSDFLSALNSGVPFIEGQGYPGVPNPATPGIIAAYSSNSADVRSFTGGLQTGYNFRSGGWVFGAEVDVNFLNAKGSKTTSAFGTVASQIPTPTLYTFVNEIDANYIVSARPRVGVLVGGGLLYATGGVAVTTLKYDHSFRGTGGFFNGIFENASASETKVGWTAGGGYELPIGSNVSLRAEYLFSDFGSVSTEGNKIFPLGFQDIPAVPDVACGVDTHQGAGFGVAGATPRQCFDHKANLFLHTIRLGLNFKF